MMMKNVWVMGVLAVVLFSGFAADREWAYLDNGTVRIGVDRSRGACVGFFGESKTGRNLLNHFDEGRFVQQSYYGQQDGSDWNGKPWVYNPVQGGSWDGVVSEILEFNETGDSLYAKIEPRSWSGGQPCPEAIMEETLSLSGAVARITFKMSFTGEDQGRPRHQEMPAVFVDAALSNLVYLSDGKLTRRVPGWPNESGKAPEQWVAYLDEDDWGIGICTPGTSDFTCYRFGQGATGPAASPCSYVSPIRTFALTNGLIVEYDVFLMVGTLDEIQAGFSAVETSCPIGE